MRSLTLALSVSLFRLAHLPLSTLLTIFHTADLDRNSKIGWKEFERIMGHVSAYQHTNHPTSNHNNNHTHPSSSSSTLTSYSYLNDKKDLLTSPPLHVRPLTIPTSIAATIHTSNVNAPAATTSYDDDHPQRTSYNTSTTVKPYDQPSTLVERKDGVSSSLTSSHLSGDALNSVIDVSHSLAPSVSSTRSTSSFVSSSFDVSSPPRPRHGHHAPTTPSRITFTPNPHR